MKPTMTIKAAFNKLLSFTINQDFANELSKLSVKEIKERYGKPIGRGSSREVYRLNNDTVIKRAVNDLGLKQNDQEEDLYRFSETPFVTKVYAISDDSRIVISEYVKPVGKSKFSQAEKNQIGIKTVKGRLATRKEQNTFEVVMGEDWEFLDDWDYNNSLVYINGGGHGYTGDFVRPSSWGKRPNGKFVLLDFGFN